MSNKSNKTVVGNNILTITDLKKVNNTTYEFRYLKALAKMIEDEDGVKFKVINNDTPVILSHSNKDHFDELIKYIQDTTKEITHKKHKIEAYFGSRQAYKEVFKDADGKSYLLTDIEKKQVSDRIKNNPPPVTAQQESLSAVYLDLYLNRIPIKDNIEEQKDQILERLNSSSKLKLYLKSNTEMTNKDMRVVLNEKYMRYTKIHGEIISKYIGTGIKYDILRGHDDLELIKELWRKSIHNSRNKKKHGVQYRNLSIVGGDINKWNPSDIWLVDSETTIKNLIEKYYNTDNKDVTLKFIEENITINRLNNIMYRLFKAKKLIGISLKAIDKSDIIKKNYRISVVNDKKEKVINIYDLSNVKVKGFGSTEVRTETTALNISALSKKSKYSKMDVSYRSRAALEHAHKFEISDLFKLVNGENILIGKAAQHGSLGGENVRMLSKRILGYEILKFPSYYKEYIHGIQDELIEKKRSSKTKIETPKIDELLEKINKIKKYFGDSPQIQRGDFINSMFKSFNSKALYLKGNDRGINDITYKKLNHRIQGIDFLYAWVIQKESARINPSFLRSKSVRFTTTLMNGVMSMTAHSCIHLKVY